ncbi:MAG: TIGR02281 family clan AA aspartic protease [Alphaproteobacteria bacterium]|nr:TIGR02281 family clan AA aspartic protease [Alphaproteobacteria bacterium]
MTKKLHYLYVESRGEDAPFMNNKSVGLICVGVLIFFLIGYLISRFPSVLNSHDNIASLVWSIALLCAFIPAGLHYFGMSKALKYAGAWMGIFAVLLIGYSFREEMGIVGNRLKTNILPFSATENKDGSVSFLRSNSGHFHIEALVNNIPIHFMVDTGASKVSLTIADAKRLGIDVDKLAYTVPIQTANGISFGAPVPLSEFKVGPIVIKDCSAFVCQNLSELSLLGMSFLEQLKGFRIEGDRLTLEAAAY